MELLEAQNGLRHYIDLVKSADVSDFVDTKSGSPEQRLRMYELRDALRGEGADEFVAGLGSVAVVDVAFMLGELLGKTSKRLLPAATDAAPEPAKKTRGKAADKPQDKPREESTQQAVVVPEQEPESTHAVHTGETARVITGVFATGETHGVNQPIRPQTLLDESSNTEPEPQVIECETGPQVTEAASEEAPSLKFLGDDAQAQPVSKKTPDLSNIFGKKEKPVADPVVEHVAEPVVEQAAEEPVVTQEKSAEAAPAKEPPKGSSDLSKIFGKKEKPAEVQKPPVTETPRTEGTYSLDELFAKKK